MERYRNRGGDSGVVAYEIGPDSITVMFSDGSISIRKHPRSVGSSDVRPLPGQPHF